MIMIIKHYSFFQRGRDWIKHCQLLPSHLLQYVFSVRVGSFWPSSSCSCFCAKICCWILLLSGHIFYFCIVNIANSALSHRQHYYGCHHHHNQREDVVIIIPGDSCQPPFLHWRLSFHFASPRWSPAFIQTPSSSSDRLHQIFHLSHLNQ